MALNGGADTWNEACGAIGTPGTLELTGAAIGGGFIREPLFPRPVEPLAGLIEFL